MASLAVLLCYNTTYYFYFIKVLDLTLSYEKIVCYNKMSPCSSLMVELGTIAEIFHTMFSHNKRRKAGALKEHKNFFVT